MEDTQFSAIVFSAVDTEHMGLTGSPLCWGSVPTHGGIGSQTSALTSVDSAVMENQCTFLLPSRLENSGELQVCDAELGPEFAE